MKKYLFVLIVLLFTLGCTEEPVEQPVEQPAGLMGKASITIEPRPVVQQITNSGFTFTPDEVSIKAGESIEFSVSSSHNVVEVSEETWHANGATSNGGFSVDFGATKTITFRNTGMYYYVCQPHAGMGMKGKVVVE